MLNDTYQDILTNPERAKAVAKEILERGHIELKDFLSPEAWEQLSTWALERKEKYAGQTGLGKGDELKGTFGYEFGHSQEIYDFCQMVHNARQELERKEKTTLDPAKHLIGFPYKDARGGAKTQETHYHFDGAYINILIPILLPKEREKHGGNLVVFPNIRQKFGMTGSKFICRILRHSALARKLYGYTTVEYHEGSGHIFFGDISFHGVEPITGEERLVMTINSHW